MNNPVCIYKPAGLTPLQAIDKVRQMYPELQSERLSYAGRLDPMAEGLLILLRQEQNHHRDDFLTLDKIYEFEMLPGVATDTYDVMGKILQQTHKIHNQLKNKISEVLPSLIGTHIYSYPPFSSKTVNGKPLHWYARHGKLSSIPIPTRSVTIKNIEMIDIQRKPTSEIFSSIKERIEMVNGDFRQTEIMREWECFFESRIGEDMPLVQCRIDSTSGTYVRGIVNQISTIVDIPMVTYSIKRTAVGPYTLDHALNLQ